MEPAVTLSQSTYWPQLSSLTNSLTLFGPALDCLMLNGSTLMFYPDVWMEDETIENYQDQPKSEECLGSNRIYTA